MPVMTTRGFKIAILLLNSIKRFDARLDAVYQSAAMEGGDKKGSDRSLPYQTVLLALRELHQQAATLSRLDGRELAVPLVNQGTFIFKLPQRE